MPRRRQAVTLADVARASGVSEATASKALNHPDEADLAPDTVARVRAAAAAAGYRVPAARQRRIPVGLVTGALAPASNGAFSGFLDALMAAGEARGLRFHLVPVLEAPADLQSERRRLQLAGILIADPMPPGLDAWALAQDLPTVLVNQYSAVPLPQVRPDDARAVALLGEHLAALGHRRIAYVQRRRIHPHPSEPARERAFRAWAAQRGMPPRVVVDEVDALCDGIGDATAVIVYNCDDAIALLHDARRRGIAVPQALSLASCDDTPELVHIEPAITATALGHGEVARIAVGLLADWLALRRPAPQVHLAAPQLLLRASTAAVSGG